jgi:hypothetical protein
MASKLRELVIPPAAIQDPDSSFEIIRVWAAGGQQHVSIQTELQGGPEDWGFLLAQLARHMANAYHIQQRLDRSQALSQIKAGFDKEWQRPSGHVAGHMPWRRAAAA